MVASLLFQELLALLDHLDTEGKGHVSVEEFVQGLQAMHVSACVSSSTPPSSVRGAHRQNGNVKK